MQTFNRICVEDWSVEAENGDRQECKRGREYLTSVADKDGTVMLFSSFWVRVPVHIFAGEREFTKPWPQPAQSETPKTDSVVSPCVGDGYECDCVSADFARTLERSRDELAGKLAEKEKTLLAVQRFSAQQHERAEQAEAALKAALGDAERWHWARPILSGDDGADSRALQLAAGLMRLETVEQIIDAARARQGREGT